MVRVLLAALLGLSFTGPVAAQDECEPPTFRGPLLLTPADGASNVTLDAPIKVEYSEDFFELHDSDPTDNLVLMDADTGVPVTGRVQVLAGSVLYFRPDFALDPTTRYEGRALGLDDDLPFTFRTGLTVDLAPPDLGAIERVTSSKVDPRCDAPDGGFRIDVSFPPATDDGPSGSIEYLLFLSRGAGTDAPQLRARARNFSTDLVTMAFVVSPEESVAPVCVVVQAVDGVGNVDEDGEARCFDPVQGNFFEPVCSVSAHPGSPSTPPVWLLLGVAALAAVRLRHRTGPARRRRAST